MGFDPLKMILKIAEVCCESSANRAQNLLIFSDDSIVLQWEVPIYIGDLNPQAPESYTNDPSTAESFSGRPAPKKQIIGLPECPVELTLQGFYTPV